MKTLVVKSLLTSLCQREGTHPSLAKRGEGRFFKNDTLLMNSLITLLFAVCCLLFTPHCFAEDRTVITAETLEYDQKTTTYIAKGKVKIERTGTTVEADEMTYNERTSEVVAKGNVRYNDPEVSMTAGSADLNLDTKTGKIFDAEILFKKDNYHVSGKEMEKKGDDYYFIPKATFTTCDAPLPAWCFSGKDVSITAKDKLQAKDTSLRIRNIPVLYTPYFQAPFLNERKTGFLIPVIGYSNQRGAHLNIPFYWAISENRDATFIFDQYTKRGIGEGLEFRYLELGNIKGKLWLYHIRDRELDKDFFELRALHEQRSKEGIGGFLNLNIVNEKDFYREYSPYRDLRISRFLESTGELSLPLENSRAYLLSQYWIDLKEETKSVSQKLPEVGYVLNPAKFGSFWLFATTAFANFWSDEGVYGQRFDLFPRILHTFGRDIVFSQTLGLRETAYSLHRTEADSPHREALEYNVTSHMRLLKRYESFTHVLEPSLGYTLISNNENNLPVFDSTELFKRTSLIELSLLNRIFNRDGEILVLRASQGFNAYQGDRPLLPFHLEVGIKSPLLMRLEATYDIHTGRLESTNSDFSVKIRETVISAGQRYNRQDNITFYNGSIGLHPYKPLYLEGRIWYDAKEGETTDMTLNIKYISQCWGVSVEFLKRPGDFNVIFRFELKGLTKSINT
jgi:LPS-assembly protein